MNDESMIPEPITAVEDLPGVHRREIQEAVKEEGRLLWAEILCLLLVAGFAVVRQLYLV